MQTFLKVTLGVILSHIIQWHISMSYILVNIMGIVTITVVDNYQDRMISKTNFLP